MKAVINSGWDRTYTPPFAELFFVKLEGRFLDSYTVEIKDIDVEEENWN